MRKRKKSVLILPNDVPLIIHVDENGIITDFQWPDEWPILWRFKKFHQGRSYISFLNILYQLGTVEISSRDNMTILYYTDTKSNVLRNWAYVLNTLNRIALHIPKIKHVLYLLSKVEKNLWYRIIYEVDDEFYILKSGMQILLLFDWVVPYMKDDHLLIPRNTPDIHEMIKKRLDEIFSSFFGCDRFSYELKPVRG